MCPPKMFSLSSKQQNRGKISLKNDSGGWIDKKSSRRKAVNKIGQCCMKGEKVSTPLYKDRRSSQARQHAYS